MTRLAVIEALWKIALADGERDAEEDALIRLVASLLGITDVDSAKARQRLADMIAGLPMYDRPELRDAHDRLWAAIVRIWIWSRKSEQPH